MALAPVDETNLLLPLFDGLFEKPLWETFLRRLAQRTGADRVRMTISNPASPGQQPLQRRVVADRLAEDPGEPEAFDSRVYNVLRPNRVYALEEIREFDRPAERATQDAALAAARIGDARLIRISGRGDIEAWIVLLHERPTFGAVDSALLTALAPAVSTVLALFAAIGGLRLRADAYRETLDLLGIDQAVLDRDGQPLGIDPNPPALPVPAFAEDCTALSAAPAGERRIVQGKVLLRPSGLHREGLTHPAAAIATWRTGRLPEPRDAARVLMQEHGLSAREAALAEALSRGVPLIEAGRALQLTDETTRNYSKRIYAKTGTSGQADLVRLVLTGLAPLA
ncbi:LuxR family transcriptional regulator [Novosphingobium sp. TH158]|uniref:LuxR family transcriptional regulator n=1 Tax=Novosphingobium sp. TH158 TaxID=2067455 RepID=UPI000C79B82C|nr:LuxR family transcriptional regulator [Novosphingobium sp. TH158]PLK26187.1 LuxR family transcriptional regulator [Novosphingobium sp. TH158]